MNKSKLNVIKMLAGKKQKPIKAWAVCYGIIQSKNPRYEIFETDNQLEIYNQRKIAKEKGGILRKVEIKILN